MQKKLIITLLMISLHSVKPSQRLTTERRSFPQEVNRSYLTGPLSHESQDQHSYIPQSLAHESHGLPAVNLNPLDTHGIPSPNPAQQKSMLQLQSELTKLSNQISALKSSKAKVIASSYVWQDKTAQARTAQARYDELNTRYAGLNTQIESVKAQLFDVSSKMHALILEYKPKFVPGSFVWKDKASQELYNELTAQYNELMMKIFESFPKLY